MSMKMFRQFQKQMEKVQDELKQMTVEATAGGGAVKGWPPGPAGGLDRHRPVRDRSEDASFCLK